MQPIMNVLAAVGAALMAASCVQAETSRQLTAVSRLTEVTTLWNPAVGPGTLDLDPNYPGLQRTVTGLQPDQIHLTYMNSTAVIASWATGDGVVALTGMPTPSYASANSAIQSIVRYGTMPGQYTMSATGFTTNYTQTYTGFLTPTTGMINGAPHLNYTSPLFHHAIMSGLRPDTQYTYIVGDPTYGFSGPQNFTSPPPLSTFPFTLGVVADVGETINSTQTMQHLLDSEPQVWTLVGDLVYADQHLTNAAQVSASELPAATSTGTVCYTANATVSTSNCSAFPTFGTYQPRWDWWYRLFSGVFTSIPLIPNSGNHELEPQYSGQTVGLGLSNNQSVPFSQFQSYLNRNPQGLLTQASGAAGGTNLYYSVEVGPVHMVVLSNYDNFAPGSPQYQWLKQDLLAYNRTRTPWLVAQWHAPWYSTYTSHYAETSCMRIAMEPLFYAAGVDIALLGHLHAYERTNPVYNYTVNQCGTVHITMGDGGNIEGLYKTFVDVPVNGVSSCPYNASTASKSVATYQPGGYCPFFPYDASNPATNGGFCPTGQPAWSAYRDPSFGHGVLTFENATHALWQWNRNLDAESVEADSVYIIRDLTCANKNTQTELNTIRSTGPAVAPSAQLTPPNAVAAAGRH